ncbi:MAG: Obg family GTPase CgtA [Candidatus Nomurabacteria bacterium]|nr:Obg family GTPase CgtA [Candidatus Nomurabacteria bacterium]
MAFIDEMKIHIRAGRGGDGVVRWRREKFKPKMGPGGGNGGNGGDVSIMAVADLSYLQNYQHDKEFKANDGQPGGKNGMEGANSADLVIKLPVGTLVTNTNTGKKWDLTKVGQTEKILRGGRGGLGNEYFKSSTNTTPYEWTPGKSGEEGDFHIELKLIAQIGLVGLPSAGKSTLINALTNAKSKVGAYHFTTLDPYLGVLPNGAVIADIPGLIEGASEGKGLGHKFLRHISRAKTIAHVLSLESDDIERDYNAIRTELGKYSASIIEKGETIILTKTDLIDESEIPSKIKQVQKFAPGKTVVAVTAFSDDDMKELSRTLSV